MTSSLTPADEDTLRAATWDDGPVRSDHPAARIVMLVIKGDFTKVAAMLRLLQTPFINALAECEWADENMLLSWSAAAVVIVST